MPSRVLCPTLTGQSTVRRGEGPCGGPVGRTKVELSPVCLRRPPRSGTPVTTDEVTPRGPSRPVRPKCVTRVRKDEGKRGTTDRPGRVPVCGVLPSSLPKGPSTR